MFRRLLLCLPQIKTRAGIKLRMRSVEKVNMNSMSNGCPVTFVAHPRMP